MPLMPKRVLHRKQQRGKNTGNATRCNVVSFGDFGIQTTQAAWVTARQIEACRVTATHYLHREGRVYIRIFPDKPISKKPLETRMGRGKGEVDQWVAPVKPGTVMFEIGGVDEETAKGAFRRMANKLAIRTRMVYRRGVKKGG